MVSAKLRGEINKTVEEISSSVHLYPGVVIIHRLPDFDIEYMSPDGLAQLGLTLEEVCALNTVSYHERYFNPDDAADYIPKIRSLVENNIQESITFFQQVRTGPNREWVWHMNIMKILLRDEKNQPVLTMAMAFKVDPLQHITTKVSRMLEENTFVKANYALFSSLTKREQNILSLLALSISAQDIAKQLFISPQTVETHRRNIRKKLNVTSFFELSQFARAFDLI